jgi:AcrR family transcriptional regulator
MQPNPRIENAKKDKVAVIFDAACAVIREKGFHQARITDISNAANISYGLVYHYFKSKSDLFDAIITEWCVIGGHNTELWLTWRPHTRSNRLPEEGGV